MNTTELNDNLIQSIKNSLLNQKSSILNKTNEFRAEQSTLSNMGDEAEVASQDLSNTISIQLHERDRHSLILIEKALSKISEGTYGQCESCGAEISSKRLEARPFTALCIDCMEEIEDAQKKNILQ